MINIILNRFRQLVLYTKSFLPKPSSAGPLRTLSIDFITSYWWYSFFILELGKDLWVKGVPASATKFPPGCPNLSTLCPTSKEPILSFPLTNPKLSGQPGSFAKVHQVTPTSFLSSYTFAVFDFLHFNPNTSAHLFKSPTYPYSVGLLPISLIGSWLM